MSSVPQLRLGLQELGFAVLEEQAVEDGGKIYSAFAAQYQGQVPDPGPLYPYLGKLTPGAPWVGRYGGEGPAGPGKPGPGGRGTGGRKSGPPPWRK